MSDDTQLVVFCDENPILTLYESNSTVRTATVSFWKVVLSPSGSGHVLIVWQEKKENTPQVYTDNRQLALFILDTFMRHFPPFDRDGLWHDVDPQIGQFSVMADVPRFYRVNYAGRAKDVVVEWRSLKQSHRHAAHSHANIIYNSAALTVENVVAVCESGAIIIDGQSVEGVVRSDDADMKAFVVLAETWSAAATF